MSYSRWTNSVWYTYWVADSDPPEISVSHRDEGVFGSVGKQFSVGLLESDLRGCSLLAFPQSVTVNESDRAELVNIFGAFLHDVALGV